MLTLLMGMAAALLIISFLRLFRKFDKATFYAFILVGIGYLYVGFAGSGTVSVMVCAIQALACMLFAYYGLWDMRISGAGFLLHGVWDIVIGFTPLSGLIPRNYSFFCLAFDGVLAAYLLVLGYRRSRAVNLNFLL